MPTRTVYDFEGNGVRVKLTFLTPLFPTDVDLMSCPVTYLTWHIRSVGGKKYGVAIYYDNTSQLVVNTEDQAVG